jgi:hypothetical protein
MKITEIISEGRKGKLDPEHASVLHGARTFTDGHGIDGSHNFNRVGLAVAMADGSNNHLDIDDRTWFHADSIAVPFSELEHKMLDQAFKAVKTSHKHIVKNHKSSEHPSVHRTSPVPVRTKNKYGV